MKRPSLPVKTRLRSELDQSIDKIAAPVAARWNYRQGDLGLLANNEVAVRLLAGGPSATLAAGDAEYLAQLFAAWPRRFLLSASSGKFVGKWRAQR